MKKIIYADIRNFREYLERCIDNKEDFKLISTSYTKKMVFQYKTIIFNTNGVDDFNVLSLINKVRTDASRYNINEDINLKEYIDYYRLYFNPQDYICVKVDLSSAYWTAALKVGVITQETDEYFRRLYDKVEDKFAKAARLKALGSLATTKITDVYKGGVIVEEESTIETQKTKETYIYINRKVDSLMKSAAMEFNSTVYYYWDCVFIANSDADDVIEYFKNEGYSSKKSGEQKIEVITIGKKKYLRTSDDEKAYMVRKEDEFLINSKYDKKIIE